jgi:hypothetical protein
VATQSQKLFRLLRISGTQVCVFKDIACLMLKVIIWIDPKI